MLTTQIKNAKQASFIIMFSPLSLLAFILVVALPAYYFNRFLLRVIQPRKSFGKFLLYMLLGFATAFLYTFIFAWLLLNFVYK